MPLVHEPLRLLVSRDERWGRHSSYIGTLVVDEVITADIISLLFLNDGLDGGDPSWQVTASYTLYLRNKLSILEG